MSSCIEWSTLLSPTSGPKRIFLIRRSLKLNPRLMISVQLIAKFEQLQNRYLCYKTTFFLFIMAFCAGCLRIQTNIDGPSPPFERILIVSKLTRTSPNYLDAYTRLFPAGYSVCTVDAGPLAFGNPDSLIRQKGRDCKSEVVLTLNAGQNYQGRNGKYACNLTDVLLELATFSDRKPFWKGLTSISALSVDAFYPGQVIRRLKQDHIISGNIPDGQ